jgi:hypothetical protein
MLRLTDGPLAHWDVISSENKRNGRVEVIETVIRRMEEGMARWGIEVPSSDDEEEQRTQAALALDDAEFQSDGDLEGERGAQVNGAVAVAEAVAEAEAANGAGAVAEAVAANGAEAANQPVSVNCRAKGSATADDPGHADTNADAADSDKAPTTIRIPE